MGDISYTFASLELELHHFPNISARAKWQSALCFSHPLACALSAEEELGALAYRVRLPENGGGGLGMF